jgi:hypothetical protein
MYLNGNSFAIGIFAKTYCELNYVCKGFFYKFLDFLIWLFFHDPFFLVLFFFLKKFLRLNEEVLTLFCFFLKMKLEIS